VFRRTIWKNDSIVNIGIYPVMTRTLECFDNSYLILWVNTLVQGFEGRYAAFRI